MGLVVIARTGPSTRLSAPLPVQLAGALVADYGAELFPHNARSLASSLSRNDLCYVSACCGLLLLDAAQAKCCLCSSGASFGQVNSARGVLWSQT